MGELLARLRAALRRAAPPRRRRSSRPPTSPSTSPPSASRADGDEVRLTPTEWQIVELLVRNPGKLVTQRQLLQEVWGPQYETETNYLRVYLAQIRRKLEPEPGRRATSSPSPDGLPVRALTRGGREGMGGGGEGRGEGTLLIC